MMDSEALEGHWVIFQSKQHIILRNTFPNVSIQPLVSITVWTHPAHCVQDVH